MKPAGVGVIHPVQPHEQSRGQFGAEQLLKVGPGEEAGVLQQTGAGEEGPAEIVGKARFHELIQQQPGEEPAFVGEESMQPPEPVELHRSPFPEVFPNALEREMHLQALAAGSVEEAPPATEGGRFDPDHLLPPAAENGDVGGAEPQPGRGQQAGGSPADGAAGPVGSAAGREISGLEGHDVVIPGVARESAEVSVSPTGDGRARGQSEAAFWRPGEGVGGACGNQPLFRDRAFQNCGG